MPARPTYTFDVEGRTVVTQEKEQNKNNLYADGFRGLLFLIDAVASAVAFSITVDTVVSIRYNYVGDTSGLVLPTAIMWGLVMALIVFVALGIPIVALLPFKENAQ